MENKEKLQQRWSNSVRMMVGGALLFPMASFAHLISIAATKPFPASVAATANASATFTVTNISAKASVTVVDQSNFQPGSGLSISSTTCGSPLGPQQSCVIQVAFEAPSTGRTVTSALKEWASPTVDAVQYPIVIKVTDAPALPAVTMEPVDSSRLYALRDPVVAVNGGNWLIMSGSTGNFHNFNNIFNPDIQVYNPLTKELHAVPVSSTDLDPAIKAQINSASSQSIQDGNTLYIVGGFYTADNIAWTTLNTITAIDIPGMVNAVINNQTNLNQFAHVRTDIPEFKVTGGQLGKIDDRFYLAYGQDCEGESYCTTQTYTNAIYKFVTDPTLASTSIVDSVSKPEIGDSGWRRRDYSLAPIMSAGVESLLAMAGPFTRGDDAQVWTNGILFDSSLLSNDNFINQQANQYAGAHLSMHSNAGIDYVATFAGLSNLYWSTSGLQYDNTTPFGNILGLIRADAQGNVHEYANFKPVCSGQPLATCLYMGIGSEFLPVSEYYDGRGILQLDQLPANRKTLVGYVYAGLVSFQQDIFALPPPPNPPNPPSPSLASNQVYAIYVTPSQPGSVNWKDITNLYPGN